MCSLESRQHLLHREAAFYLGELKQSAFAPLMVQQSSDRNSIRTTAREVGRVKKKPKWACCRVQHGCKWMPFICIRSWRFACCAWVRTREMGFIISGATNITASSDDDSEVLKGWKVVLLIFFPGRNTWKLGEATDPVNKILGPEFRNVHVTGNGVELQVGTAALLLKAGKSLYTACKTTSLQILGIHRKAKHLVSRIGERQNSQKNKRSWRRHLVSASIYTNTQIHTCTYTYFQCVHNQPN